jgi:hypothetical protein
VLLGQVAMRAGVEIHWDPKQMQVTNHPQANQYITKEYRKGWEV